MDQALSTRRQGSTELPDDPRIANTRHLSSLTRGGLSRESMDALFTACRSELRAVAGRLMRNERFDHTLQPTALVNEAYLRLFDVPDLPATSRAHFVNIAARSMRQILVEHARRRHAAKRGGGRQAVTLIGMPGAGLQDPLDLLILHDLLERLAALDPRAAEIVELRIFGGLGMEEIATLVGVSRRTIQRDWRFAIMWLRHELADLGT